MEVAIEKGAIERYCNAARALGLVDSASLVERMFAEITHLHERLQDDHVIDAEGKRVEVEPGSIPDKIDCQQETIKAQDANVNRLNNLLAAEELRANTLNAAIEFALRADDGILWLKDWQEGDKQAMHELRMHMQKSEPIPEQPTIVEECNSSTFDLIGFSKRNWRRVPSDTREACINKLRQCVPPNMLNTWKDQVRRGVPIGSDNIMFHFGVGMQIRNALREVIKDNDLPPVKYQNVDVCNWDDYYHGALYDFVTRQT